jgi:hypothetical protein
MRRSPAVLAALISVGIAAVTPSHAASPLSGTIECSASGAIRFSPPFLPTEIASPNTRPLPIKISNDASTCDGSGVVGADGYVGAVVVKIQGKAAADTSCGDFFDAVSYTATVRLRWRGSRNLGSSKTPSRV